MDEEEFYEWAAYYNIEPWGSIIDGYRNASITFTVANAISSLLGNRQRRSRLKLDNFLVGVKKDAKRNKSNPILGATLKHFAQKNRKKNNNDSRKT